MSTIINSLGYQNFVDYVLNNSTFKKNQFTFAMEDGTGYASFLVAENNKLNCLGKFSYDRFIGMKYLTDQKDLIAISRFLDLCIKKLQNKDIIIPDLYGNPDMWNDVYKSE